MKSVISNITNAIEKIIDKGGDAQRKIVVYPYGEIGIRTVEILRNVYQIEPLAIFDNYKCQYNNRIKSFKEITQYINKQPYIIIATTNRELCQKFKEECLLYFDSTKIVILDCVRESPVKKVNPTSFLKTKIGRYSYGPLCCDNELIEEIGSFCSFAPGVKVLANHVTDQISTHPMFYRNCLYEGVNDEYKFFRNEKWYFPDVTPPVAKQKRKRITIGNDVWLGENVLITNYSCIGDGVIAGAGSIITRDVPNYAVVVGAPAKIIRYRYTQEQINAMENIKWWNWSDDMIKERYDDFFLDIDSFINKYNYEKYD